MQDEQHANDETTDGNTAGPSSTLVTPLEARVNEALEALDGLDTVPVVGHVERFEAVHAALADALSTIDRI